jgi:glycosyltransferase involved in cell wall biosynthesis
VADDSPYFSVVIPTFNRAGYIGKAIQSLLDQQFTSFEIIIVDDGGTDNTAEVVAAFADSRIRFVQKENAERAAARNHGVMRANGLYVTFLDSDDFVKPDFFKAAHEFIQHNPSTAVFHTGYDVVDERGATIKAWKRLPSPVNYKLIEGNFLSCLGIFVKREVIIHNLFNDDRALSGSEDYELWMRLASRFPIHAHSRSTACLVNHATRSVVTMDDRKLLNRLALLRKYLMADQQFLSFFKSKIHKFEAFLHLYAALHLAMDGHYDLAEKSLRMARRGYKPIIFNYRYWVAWRKLFSK